MASLAVERMPKKETGAPNARQPAISTSEQSQNWAENSWRDSRCTEEISIALQDTRLSRASSKPKAGAKSIKDSKQPAAAGTNRGNQSSFCSNQKTVGSARDSATATTKLEAQQYEYSPFGVIPKGAVFGYFLDGLFYPLPSFSYSAIAVQPHDFTTRSK